MRRYFEFALAVIIIAVVSAFVLQGLEKARSETEAASVQMEVMAIRAQLMEMAVHRQTFGGNLPASNNPMDWVTNQPLNYRGAGYRPPEEREIWYFDGVAGELIYRFRDGRTTRFRLSRESGSVDGRGIAAGIGLLRLNDR